VRVVKFARRVRVRKDDRWHSTRKVASRLHGTRAFHRSSSAQLLLQTSVGLNRGMGMAAAGWFGRLNPFSSSEGKQMTTRCHVSRGQVVYLATPDSTAVVKGSSTSDVLSLLQTELMMVTEVEDEG
jgi:hypothetical protein